MDFIGHGLDQRLEEVGRNPLRGLFVHLDEGELRGSVDGDQEIELTLFGTHLGDIDMEVADRIDLELLAPGTITVPIGKSGDAVPFEAAVQRRPSQLGDGRLQGIETVVKRQQRMPAKGNDNSFLLKRKDGGLRGWPGLPIRNRGPIPPLGDGLRVDAMPPGQRPQALLTMLYRSTHCRCRALDKLVDKIILITGVSSGLGKALAEEALQQGCLVVGTVRKEEDSTKFMALKPGHAFGRLLDVQHTGSMPALVAEIESSVGPINVLVNNAGYGLAATIEEAPLDQIREQFEINVFGPIGMLQAVLPGMRRRRAGCILNITSMGGLLALPGIGIYNATKFALEGVTEALRKEVAEFNIRVIAVEPGMFKTDWIGRSLRQPPGIIADYDAQRKARAEQTLDWNGDVVKAAKAMLNIVDEPNPPGHLLLGSIANKLVDEKLANLRFDIERYRALSESTDLDR